MLGCRRIRPVLRDHKTTTLSNLGVYSEQQLSWSMSFRKDVAASLIDSVIVGKTCTVSMMSSIVSLYLAARTDSWIISAAQSAWMCTPNILPVEASVTLL